MTWWSEPKNHGLSDYCINQGLAEIEMDEYENTAKELLRRKLESLQGQESIRKEKSKRYLANRGYEYDLINRLLSEM